MEKFLFLYPGPVFMWKKNDIWMIYSKEWYMLNEKTAQHEQMTKQPDDWAKAIYDFQGSSLWSLGQQPF